MSPPSMCERKLQTGSYGSNIHNVQSTKFFGMILDERLTWRPHIRYVKKRCSASLNILKKLYGSKWGADRSSMLKVYFACVRSVLDYGSITYATASKNDLSKLNTIQNNALRLCTGSFRISPATKIFRISLPSHKKS